MTQCGEKPRLLAIGVAPIGIVSIGVVPMGIVSIGVVPMGVVSLGVVGMGVINACVVGMGVLVAGVHGMGVWTVGSKGLVAEQTLHHHARPRGFRAQEPLLAYPSRAEALAKAQELGCQGAHAMGSRWMPCSTHPPAGAGHGP